MTIKGCHNVNIKPNIKIDREIALIQNVLNLLDFRTPDPWQVEINALPKQAITAIEKEIRTETM